MPRPTPGLLLRLAAGFALLGAVTAGRPSLTAGAGNRPPNILLVTIDTLRADRVGAYGSKKGLTPVMDRIARTGVLFTRATVQVPLTRPSHVSLLTGKLPFQHGIRDNLSYSLAPEHRTLAQVLQAQGFATGGFVGAFMLNAQSGLNRGFDEFDDEFPAGGGSSFLAEHQRRAAEVERRAGAWIERVARGPRPFFAWVHFYDPHSPYDPPPPYAARFAAHPYDGEVAYTDAVLGRLLGRLERLGIAGRTLVVVTSDHGEGLGGHGEAEHGFFLYETTLRVPLMARWPGGLPAGVRVTADARSIDVMPTILDLAGAAASTPPALPGRSLVPLVREPRVARAAASYAETLFPRIHFDCSELRSLTLDGWKYVEAPRPELYDLRADPDERTNLFAREGQRARSMRSRLLDEMGGSAEAGLVGVASPKIDAETRRRLSSLGYVTGSGGSGGRGDPKDAIADFQSYTRRVRGAFEAYDRGDFKAAIAGFETATAGGRAAFDVYFYLGSAYAKLGQPAKAIVPLLESVRQNPAYTASSLQLAEVYSQLNRTADAIAVLRRAIENDPRDFDLRMNLSSIYRDAGEGRRALEEVDAALGTRPLSADAHNQRGMLLGGAGRDVEAAEAFQRALTLSPANAQFCYNLGLARLRAGDRPAAAAAARRALALKPDFADARTLLAQAERK